jgi:hypothetical protein
MGLDITVYKPIKLKGDAFQETEDFFNIEENPELESIFPDFIFEKENEYYDLESELKEQGYDPGDLSWRGTSFNDAVIYTFSDKDGNEVEIKVTKTIKKIDKCIAVEEVGYQRKGANKKFYEDGMWDSPCTVDSETLDNHWKNYFSKQTPESKGGWGSGVEYVQDDEEMKRNFKENIIDKFVEGETFVIYH